MSKTLKIVFLISPSKMYGRENSHDNTNIYLRRQDKFVALPAARTTNKGLPRST